MKPRGSFDPSDYAWGWIAQEAAHFLMDEGAGNRPLSIADIAAQLERKHGLVGDARRAAYQIESRDDPARGWELLAEYAVKGMLKAKVIVERNGGYVWASDRLEFSSFKSRIVLHSKEVRMERERAIEGSFDPVLEKGVFAGGIRGPARHADVDDELEQSMREFGWLPEFPAIRDEFGVVLVGNRRLATAAKLGIESQIRDVVIGTGETADAHRFRLAVASNLGGRPFSPQDRKRIAAHLYADAEWSVERLAEALRVEERTIRRDLVEAGVKPRRGKAKGATPEWNAVHDPIIRGWLNGEYDRAEAVRRGKATGVKPCSNGTYDRRKAALEAVPTSDIMSETGRGFEAPKTPAKDTPKPSNETSQHEHVWVCSICGERA